MCKRYLQLALFTILALVPPCLARAQIAVVCSSQAPGLNNSALATAMIPLLARAGYTVKTWDPAARGTDMELTPSQCALLVLPACTRLPEPAILTVEHFLQLGGNVFAAGTPVGTVPMLPMPDRTWKTLGQVQQLRAFQPPSHVILQPSASTHLGLWSRNTNTSANPTVSKIVSVPVNGNDVSVLSTQISNLQGWDTFQSPKLTDPFPPGNTVTVFTARGDKNTGSLSVEWDDEDGSRWIAVVPLSTTWRRYALIPAEFKPWMVPDARIAAGFLPQQANRISVGLAYSHTGAEPGAHSYEVAELGTAPASAAVTQGDALAPETALSPAYKFFRMHTAVRLTAAQIPGDEKRSTASRVVYPRGLMYSVQPRPGADGFMKNRLYREITLLTARDAVTHEWRGIPAALFIPGSVGKSMGLRLVFTPSSTKFYSDPVVKRLLQTTLVRIKRGLFLVEAGSQFYTLFKNQGCDMGAVVTNNSNAPSTARRCSVSVRVSNGAHVLWSHLWKLSVDAQQTSQCSARWTPDGAIPAKGDRVVTSLIVNGKVIDRSTMNVHEWLPPAKPRFVRTKSNGHFYLDNHLWRINGVNYLPSSGIATSHGLYFESWMSARSYDPRIVGRDLTRIKKLGFNAVSAFIYTRDIDAQNLLDFLWLCRNLGLRVNLSLRPGVADYLGEGRAIAEQKSWANFRSIIERYQLRLNDTVFAYEISWEPSFGDYSHRVLLDAAWRRWVSAKYGTVAAAESAWKYKAPMASGLLTGPSDVQLTLPTGEFVRFVADYRAFLDSWLQQTFGESVRRIHSLDPNHLVSFRMASAGDSSYRWTGALPYQLEGLSRAVDFLSPECYGRVGDPSAERTIPFELGYARGVAPHLPVIWAETGMSVWDGGHGRDSVKLLRVEGHYYSVLYKATLRMNGDGIFFWWYPGGFRVNEGSDFGLVNEDGTNRPATLAVLKYGPLLLHLPLPKSQYVYLKYNPANHPDGPAGAFAALDLRFSTLLAAGKMPIPVPSPPRAAK